MCSNTCPCPLTPTLTIPEQKNWLKMKESDLKALDRTLVTDKVTVLSPLIFLSKSQAEKEKKQTFESFASCLEAVVDGSWVPADTNAIAAFKSFAERNNVAEVKAFGAYFSENHGCSGYCSEALFGFGASIKGGKPLGNCRDSILSEMSDTFTFPCVVAFLTALVSIVTFAGQYLLWKEYPQPEDPDER